MVLEGHCDGRGLRVVGVVVRVVQRRVAHGGLRQSGERREVGGGGAWRPGRGAIAARVRVEQSMRRRRR